MILTKMTLITRSSCNSLICFSARLKPARSNAYLVSQKMKRSALPFSLVEWSRCSEWDGLTLDNFSNFGSCHSLNNFTDDRDSFACVSRGWREGVQGYDNCGS